MSTRSPTTRRALLAGAAATLASPALAQRRRLGPYDDPGADDFYDTRTRRPGGRGWDPELDSDPYGQYPFGSQRRRPALANDPAAAPVDTAGADGAFDWARIYAPVAGDPFPIPGFNIKRVRPEFLRREVDYRGSEPAGAIVVDPGARHLFFVEGDGRAIRYGVGVGRQGFAWSGVATINSKQVWPDWYPPKEMIERDPHLAGSLSELQSGIGMAGGPRNPLGARALYLWQGNKDTLYRIHGTTEPWTIGTRASSGCIRMINQDAIDLYARVNLGTEVRVLG